MIFKSGHALEQYPKNKKLGLGKVLDSWSIYPAYLSMNDILLPLRVKGLITWCFYYSKNANKKNVNQRKNQNIPSGYLPVESQQ